MASATEEAKFVTYDVIPFGPRVILRFVGDMPAWQAGTIVRHATGAYFEVMVVGDTFVLGRFVTLKKVEE